MKKTIRQRLYAFVLFFLSFIWMRFNLLVKEINLYADINNIDMKNESFSYLLPKSGSRSFYKTAFFYENFSIITKNNGKNIFVCVFDIMEIW